MKAIERHPELDRRVAVVMEQYRDHTEAYLPGMGPEWHTSGVTPDAALDYLLQLIQRHQPHVPGVNAPMAVSLVTVHPNATDLHPATVEHLPRGAMVLFEGRLLAAEESPEDAECLASVDSIPDDAPQGRVYLVPPHVQGLVDADSMRTAETVIRAQTGEGFRILPEAGPVVVKFPARLIRVNWGPWGEPRHDGSPVK